MLNKIYFYLTYFLLKKINYGSIELTLPNSKKYVFGDKEKKSSLIKVNVSNWSVFRNFILRGSFGLGEDYIHGLWSVNMLDDFLVLAAKNYHDFENIKFLKPLKMIFQKIRHSFIGIKRLKDSNDLSYHYDVGNEFYKIWLDPSLTYSSALYEGKELSLEEAQANKRKRSIDSLELDQQSNVLEIGCGWGALAKDVSARGHQMTSITLSKEQYKYVKENTQGNEKVDLILRDYKDQEGQFDGILSIEMIESIGMENWPSYFKKLEQCLKKGKRAVIQVITIADEHFDLYCRTKDFIKDYVFPGGALISKSKFLNMASSEGLKVKNILEFGDDYAKTLSIWLQNFNNQKEKVMSLGYDDSFFRLWSFYLCYCIAGFKTGRIDVVQFTLEK